MSRFWEIVFCVPLLFRRHGCLSNLKLFVVTRVTADRPPLVLQLPYSDRIIFLLLTFWIKIIVSDNSNKIVCRFVNCQLLNLYVNKIKVVNKWCCGTHSPSQLSSDSLMLFEDLFQKPTTTIASPMNSNKMRKILGWCRVLDIYNENFSLEERKEEQQGLTKTILKPCLCKISIVVSRSPCSSNFTVP